MKLYIHTSGRATIGEQKTLSTFASADSLLSTCVLLVQDSQKEAYAPIAKNFGVKLIALPPEIKTLSPTRQWIMDRESRPFAMMDDDLLFFKRRPDEETKFLKIIDYDVEVMFSELFRRMDEGNFAHGGILAREGGNRILGVRDVYNTRMMRVLAYDPKVVRKVGARFDRLPTKQDFDMTLQLLRAGYPNMLMADYVQGQYGDGCSNAPGGCSIYRTPAMMKECSEQLAALHPEFVKVVTKSATTSWGGGDRIDVRIAWKQAAKAGGIRV